MRDLTGNVSTEALREFAVGYGIRRFKVGSNVIDNTHVSFDDIDLHVFVTKMTMRRSNAIRSSNMLFMSAINYVGKWKELALKMINSSAGALITYMLSFSKDINIDQLITGWFNSPEAVAITNHAFNNQWNELLETAQASRSFKRVVFDNKINTENSFYCNHHMNCQNHQGSLYCICCGCQSDDDYCACCAVFEKPQNIITLLEEFNIVPIIDLVKKTFSKSQPQAKTLRLQSKGYKLIKSENNIKWHSHICPVCQSVYIHQHSNGDQEHEHKEFACMNMQCSEYTNSVLRSHTYNETAFKNQNSKLLDSKYKLTTNTKPTGPKIPHRTEHNTNRFNKDAAKNLNDSVISEEQ